MARTASLSLLLAILAAVSAVPAAAQLRETVSFAKGSSTRTITGSLKGDAYVDYVVNAGAGQMLTVDLKTGRGATYFNVMPPGSDTAVHIGSTSGNQYSGAIATTGNQVVRVYQMRSAGRRGESTAYTLTIAVTGRRGQ